MWRFPKWMEKYLDYIMTPWDNTDTDTDPDKQKEITKVMNYDIDTIINDSPKGWQHDILEYQIELLKHLHKKSLLK